MNIQLIKGQFKSNDALDLITQMIHTKIKYHENKINFLNNEEDIKSRESKIIRLQKELLDLRNMIGKNKKDLKIEAVITIAN
jgi:hypothetical protein